jgi:chloramphenicol 3-O-phosphotransferase
MRDNLQIDLFVSGKYGQGVNTAFHEIVKALLDSGHNLVIDGVIEVNVWEQELRTYSLTKVGVICSLPELAKREALRAGGMQGSATKHITEFTQV